MSDEAWRPPEDDRTWRGTEHPQPQPGVEQDEYDQAEVLRFLEEIAGSATCETEDEREDPEC